MHSTQYNHGLWDKISVVCFLNLICFGSFYLSTVFITELAPPRQLPEGGPDVFSNSMAFFVGFLARPLGALWFGMRGDLTSSRKAIRESVTVMVISTALMGIFPSTPTSDDFIFVLLRCVQGIGLGGSYAAMAVFLYEAAPRGQKSRYTSFIQASVPVGYIAALLGVLLFKMIFAGSFYVEGGWRLAFFMPLVAFFFLGAFKDPRPYDISGGQYLGWLRSCSLTVKKEWKHWAPYLVLTVGIGVLAFMAANYRFYFMKVIVRIDPVVVDFASALGTILYLPFYYWGALLTDKYDKFKTCWWSVVLGAIFLVPSFWLYEQASRQEAGQVLTIVLGIVMLGSVVVISFGSLISLLCDLFPPKMRCTLFALVYNLTVGVIGAVAHGYGIESFNATGARYSGLFLAVFLAGSCALLSLFLRFRQQKVSQ